jgi:phage gp46-like protein
MDFGLEDNLDMQVVDDEYVSQQNGEATLINAFFTDARVNEKRGYWLDIMASDIWTYEQSRLTNQIATELTDTAKEIADDLVKDGLYRRIDVEAYITDMIMTLDVKCYDDKGIVVDRKFAI